MTFTKQWSGFPAGMTAGLPSVKVTLVRYLTDATGAAIAGTREAAFAAAPTNTSANTVTLTYANAASQTAVWTSLAYYGPNTRPYLYRVEETGTAAGTTVYAADGTTRLTANAAGAYEAPVTGTFDNAAGTGSGVSVQAAAGAACGRASGAEGAAACPAVRGAVCCVSSMFGSLLPFSAKFHIRFSV